MIVCFRIFRDYSVRDHSLDLTHTLLTLTKEPLKEYNYNWIRPKSWVREHSALRFHYLDSWYKLITFVKKNYISDIIVIMFFISSFLTEWTSYSTSISRPEEWKQPTCSWTVTTSFGWNMIRNLGKIKTISIHKYLRIIN